MANDRIGYGQYCPISRAAEILGERWSIPILRDLLIGYTRFNELARGQPGLSRSLLSKRLRQFERAGIVDHVGDEYLLTEAGRELLPIVFSIGEWGAKWAFGDPEPEELDAELLVWWMHRRLDTTVLPDRPRWVFQLRFTDEQRLFWVLIERGNPSVCYTDPGFGVDVTISSDLASLYKIWLGRLPVKDAARAGVISFDGPPALTRRMQDVLMLSQVSDAVAAVTEHA